MHRILIACLGLIALLSSPAAAQRATDLYSIQAGDQLSISVLEDPGLNTTVLVRPDGRITIPLAGTILAEGRSPEDVQNDIRRALSESFLEPPTVTVTLVGVGAAETLRTVYVIGEVGQPGAYRIEPDRSLDLLQLLALAGGPGPFAATRRIQVRRTAPDGSTELQLFDYKVVEEGELPLQRILLSDGDVVVVPERGLFE